MYPAANLYLTGDLNISDVVLDNPRIMLLLEHFNIYLPFQDKSIQKVCGENDLSSDVFLTFANLYNGISYTSVASLTFTDIKSILVFLKNSHIYYTGEMYPLIQGIIKEMSDVNNHKEMTLVDKFFHEYFREVLEHLNYEDTTAFPYMKDLHEQIVSQTRHDGPVTYSVRDYKEHHNDIEEKLTDLKNLLIKYLPRKNDQKLRRKLISYLSELEFDLNIHAKIEDLILIPLVEQMEQLRQDLK